MLTHKSLDPTYGARLAEPSARKPFVALFGEGVTVKVIEGMIGRNGYVLDFRFHRRNK
jgi:hypothetical protein